MLIIVVCLIFQTVCLAEFKQIRSIKCTAQSDSKTLLDIDIKGAKQVSTSPRFHRAPPLWFQAIKSSSQKASFITVLLCPFPLSLSQSMCLRWQWQRTWLIWLMATAGWKTTQIHHWYLGPIKVSQWFYLSF